MTKKVNMHLHIIIENNNDSFTIPQDIKVALRDGSIYYGKLVGVEAEVEEINDDFIFE